MAAATGAPVEVVALVVAVALVVVVCRRSWTDARRPEDTKAEGE